jgi:uncharacterized Zn-finger protein
MEVFVEDEQMVRLKAHLTDSHDIYSDADSIVYLAFMNAEEKAKLGQLVRGRIKNFFKMGQMDLEGNVFKNWDEAWNEETDDIPDIDETVSDDEDDLTDSEAQVTDKKEMLTKMLGWSMEKAKAGIVDITDSPEKVNSEEELTKMDQRNILNVTNEHEDSPTMPMVKVKEDVLENVLVKKEGELKAADFCRLCYSGLAGTSEEEHRRREHQEDTEAFSLESTEENLAHCCPLCPLKYLTERLLNTHKKAVHRLAVKERKVGCKICNKIVQRVNIHKHLATHREKTLECKLCYAKFSLPLYLSNHHKKHNEDQALLERDIKVAELKFDCTKCEKKFATSRIFDYHKQYGHTKSFNCTLCSEKLLSRKVLLKHSKEIHGKRASLGDQAYQCKLCYRRFTLKSNMNTHRKVHKGDQEAYNRDLTENDLKFACLNTSCGQKFVSKSILEYHTMYQHRPDIKPNKCLLCYKTFAKIDNLKTHIRLHKEDLHALDRVIADKDLKFMCSEQGCGQKFLSEHILNYHTNCKHRQIEFKHLRDPKAKIHVCPLCFTKFKSFYNMHSHILDIHNDEKGLLKVEEGLKNPTHRCKKCDRQFMTFSILTYHYKRVHKKQKVYKDETKRFECKLCYKAFSKGRSLYFHKKIHKEDQDAFGKEISIQDLTVVCSQSTCGQKFVSENILKYHTNSVHREKEFKHLRNTTAKLHTCPLCYTEFKSFYTMHSHILDIHDEDKDLLKTNGGLDNPKYECDKCKKRFMRPSILKYHSVRVHKEQLSLAFKSRLECPLCYNPFQSTKNLKTHLQNMHKHDENYLGRVIHDSELIKTCPMCPKKFVSERSLVLHTDRGHRGGESKKHKCDECPKSFDLHLKLRKHSIMKHNKKIARHSGRKEIVCKLCYISFTFRGNMSKHIAHIHKTNEEQAALQMDTVDVSASKFNCEPCDVKFLTQNIMNYHTRYRHKESTAKGIYCKLCHLKYKHPSVLANHKKKIHKNEMQYFSIKMEENELKYSCNECNRKFVTENILSHHNRYRHNTLQPRETACVLCQIEFKNIYQQRAHVKNIHRSEEEKLALDNKTIEEERLIFICKHCDKKFLTANILSHHKKYIHRRLQPRETVCRLCQVNFGNIYKQRAHVKNVHKAEEEREALKLGGKLELDIPCMHCDKLVFSAKTLQYHTNALHKEVIKKEDQQCEFCNKVFSWDHQIKKRIKSHMRSVHGIKDEKNEKPADDRTLINFKHMMDLLNNK